MNKSNRTTQIVHTHLSAFTAQKANQPIGEGAPIVAGTRQTDVENAYLPKKSPASAINKTLPRNGK
jgi:hypothetical protein